MARGQDNAADPYRTLGLEPGASAAEIKRAYRLLAKAFHPDSAGEETLPRFLAIHAAYEQLKTGKVLAGLRSSRPAPPPAAEPWRADPSRARAARERARTARGGPAAGTRRTGASASSGSGGSSGATGGAGASGASGATGAAGPAGTGTGRRGTASSGTSSGGTSSGGGRSGRRRDVRKATMGSTSYDEARDPSDATWSGASWYGPSSGEYWIVNPREYADPRKHGPEYQQRARRPIEGSEVASGSVAGEFADTGTAPGFAPGSTTGASARSPGPAAERAESPTASDASWRGQARTSARTRDRSKRRASSWSTTGANRDRDPGVSAQAAGAWPASAAPGESGLETDRVEALGAASRAWLGRPADDPIRRLGLALVAWPPIGLAAAAAIGEVTGCASFAADCGGSEPLLPWLAQAAILGLLLLMPPIARLLAGGAIAVLVALLPITVFLLAVGGGSAPQAGGALAVLLGVAWLVGIGWSARTFLWASQTRGGVGPAGPAGFAS